MGAGLLLDNGKTVLGVNYESASYGLTMCAERTAIARAQADGLAPRTIGIVISARHPDSDKAPFNLTPCGACRQVISEFAAHDIPIYIGDEQGNSRETSLYTLLPEHFGPGHLA